MTSKAHESAGNAQPEAGAWSRFERAVDAAVKSGPKHKPAPEGADKKARPASKARADKAKK